MKKTLLSVLALMLCAVMVFSFAACGGKDDPETTSEPPVENSTEAPSGDETAAPTEAPSGDATVAPTEAPTAGKTDVAGPTEAKPIAKPADLAAGVKLYNEALAKAKCSSANVNRSLNSATIIGIPLDSFTNPKGGVSKMFAEGSGNTAAKLSALAAGDVASYTVAENGNTYVMTFKLKDSTKNNQTAKLGKGGFMYYFTLDEVEKVVMQIGHAIGGDYFDVQVYKDQSTFDLKNGVFTVTVDKTTGKMTAAKLSLVQNIVGKCNAPINGKKINATAKIEGKATVDFKVS